MGDELFVLRLYPHRTGNLFGFQDNDGNGKPQQRVVIAQYAPDLGEEMEGDDGYGWRFPSRGIDDVYFYEDADTFKVTAFEVIDSNTIYAATVEIGIGHPKIWRGDRAGDVWAWQYCASASEQKVLAMMAIPGRDLLALAIHKESSVGLEVMKLDAEGTPEDPLYGIIQWLGPDVTSDPVLLDMGYFAHSIACDPSGSVLYLGSHGEAGSGVSDHYPGGLMRLIVPESDEQPGMDQLDWEILATGSDPSFQHESILPALIPDLWKNNGDISERLFNVESIVVDPYNPLHVFMGLRYRGMQSGGSLCARQGAYEYLYDPDSGTGSWVPRFGLDADGEPATGVYTLALRSDDNPFLVVGTDGQEFFRVDGVTLGTPPEVEDVVLEAIHESGTPPEGQTLLMVEVSSSSEDPLEFVWVDMSPLGLDSRLYLDDDGTGGTSGDWVADDGIWTADVAGFTQPAAFPAEYSLQIVARDEGYNTYVGELAVTVIETPGVYYYNGSNDSGFEFTGIPTGVAAVDMNSAGSTPADEYHDVLLSQFGSNGVAAFQIGRVDDVPQYEDQHLQHFQSGGAPVPDHGPAVSADLNGDGRQDLIVTSGASDETGDNLLFYEQDSNGMFIRRPEWNPLTTEEQEHIWAAACGDFDGDGQIDVYLCRSNAPSGDLPRPGQSGQPDILLRNDLASSGIFVVEVEAFEIPLDGDNHPIHLASRTAAWCDYDADGDLDLAVADAALGHGIYVYENDPLAGSQRFSIVYPDDPVPGNNLNVSDLAWMDYDADGDQDIVVTSFYGDGSSGAPYFYENGSLATGGVFGQTAALSVAPPHHSSGVRVQDFDLDGRLDFLMLPDEENGSTMLALNTGLEDFQIAGAEMGLESSNGQTRGGLVCDLNGDGGAEMFLGRPRADSRFLHVAKGGAVVNSWVGLSLVIAESDGSIAPAYGARVVFTNAPDQTVAMTVGANGQTDPTLRIGYQTGFGPSCTIQWPNGHSTSHVFTGSETESVTQLSQPTDFVINSGSVRGYPELLPLGNVDWIFEWTTNYQTDTSLDRIEFTPQADDPFIPPRPVLAAGDADVAARQWLDLSTGSPVYRHEIRLLDQVCAPQWHRYQAVSQTLAGAQIDGQYIFRIKACTSGDPNDPQNPPGGN